MAARIKTEAEHFHNFIGLDDTVKARVMIASFHYCRSFMYMSVSYVHQKWLDVQEEMYIQPRE